MSSPLASHDLFAEFSIDAASAQPPFQQLQSAIIDAVSSGELVPGTKLPTVRGLAAQLGLATNTVASAYRALEASGIVEGRGRAGTFVKLDADGDDPIAAEARRIALETARALSTLGVDLPHAQSLLADAYRAQ